MDWGILSLCMATPLVRYADCLDMGVVRARSCVLSSVNPLFFSVLRRDGGGNCQILKIARVSSCTTELQTQRDSLVLKYVQKVYGYIQNCFGQN